MSWKSKVLGTVTAGVLTAAMSVTALADDIKLKLAGVHPVDHYGDKMLSQLAADIEAADVGLTVQVFPAGQLGSGEELLDDAMRGNIDLVHSYIYPNRDSTLEVTSLPFLATSNEDVEKIYMNPDSQFNQILRESFDGLGLEYFGVVPEGFIGVVSEKKPDNYATDGDKNLNIRVWGSQLAKATVESIGFRSTTMNWGEVFAAIQAGTVDGAICCTAQTTYTTFAVSDVGKYFIPYNAMVEVTAYYASRRTWEKLNDEQKAAVKAAVAKAQADFTKWALENDAEYMKRLTEAGYEVLDLTTDQRAALAAHVRETVWPSAADIVGQDVLDRLQGQ